VLNSYFNERIRQV